MRRTISACISFVLFFCGVLCINTIYDRKIRDEKESLIYYNSDYRNNVGQAIETLLEDNTILVFGSSELFSYSNIYTHPKNLFHNGNSNYNPILVGRDYTQSLIHTLNVGAYDNYINNRKVVLILSPQWFTQTQYNPEMFASRFQESIFVAFCKNPSIKYETKRKVIDRVKQYLRTGDQLMYEKVLLYEKVYIEKTANIPELLHSCLWESVLQSKNKHDLIDQIVKIEDKPYGSFVDAESINYSELLTEAKLVAEKACTNNKLYIYNDYYTMYVEPDYYNRKNAETMNSYLVSPEYNDLELFIQVCKEVGINPLIVNIPVHGIWYDWTGFPKGDRKAYYQNIRDICSKHGVSIADYSDKEYENYFLRDIMHLGWTGWVHLNESIYRFHLNKEEKIRYPFNISAYIYDEENGTHIKFKDHISDIQKATLAGNTVLTQSNDGYLEGVSKSSITNNTIEGEGQYGAGIVSSVAFIQSDIIRIDEMAKSDGITINGEDCISIKTEMDDNRFSSVNLQLWDNDGSFLFNILSSGKGKVNGEYEHDLPDGWYTIQIRGNSNILDEVIESKKVFFKEGDVFHYSYDIITMLPTKIQINDILLWKTGSDKE